LNGLGGGAVTILFKRLIFILAVVGVGHTLFIVFDGLRDNISAADVILILGNKVEEDGTPSERLKKRLDKGLELYLERYAGKIVVSGAAGKEGFDEAFVMKKYLKEKGVQESDIIMDNRGYNTWFTAKNFEKIAEKENFSSVITVSHYYHITRIGLALKKFKKVDIYSAHADSGFALRDLYSIPREVVAFYYYLVKY